MRTAWRRAHLASNDLASFSAGGEVASRSRRFVGMMTSKVKGTTAPTNAPPAIHPVRCVNHHRAALESKQITAKEACMGAARL